MQRTLVLTWLLPLSVAGVKCSPGRRPLADLTSRTCSLKGSDAKSCNSNCCEDDKLTCGGMKAGTGISCPFDSFIGGGMVAGSWDRTATNETSKNKDCCAKKAKCGAAPACKAGWKPKTGVADVMCPADARTCQEVTVTGSKKGVCCELDVTTCGGLDIQTAQTCSPGPPGTYKGSDDAWKKTKITTTFQASCCQSSPTCASTGYSCPAGYVRDEANKDLTCKGGVKTCIDQVTTSANKYCCKANGCASRDKKTNPTRCALPTNDCGNPATDITCTSSYYPKDDDWFKNRKVNNADKNKMVSAGGCCAPLATCVSAVCEAGSKKKAGKTVDKLQCKSDAASCNVKGSACCEADTTKCGGLSGIVCAWGYYDESMFFVTDGPTKKQTPKAEMDAWKNKPATEATKNVACCTAKALCSGVAIPTTTPAATVTPATAIRRYSEHKLRQGTSTSSANLVWLCVGGFIGMSTLLAVQGLRSRTQAVDEADAREVDDLLLDSTTE